jgi:hypothetical protein
MKKRMITKLTTAILATALITVSAPAASAADAKPGAFTDSDISYEATEDESLDYFRDYYNSKRDKGQRLTTGSAGFAAEELAAQGVVKGNGDGRFRPDDLITAGDFGTLLLRAVTFGKDTPGGEPGRILCDMGVTDDPDDFKGNKNIGYAKAVEAVTRAMGLADEAKKLGGGTGGYLAVAKNTGLTDGGARQAYEVAGSPNDPLSRGFAALLVYNSALTNPAPVLGGTSKRFDLVKAKDGGLLSPWNIVLAKDGIAAGDFDSFAFAAPKTAKVYYTLDGKDPSENSLSWDKSRYRQYMNVPAEVKAVSVNTRGETSEVSTFRFSPENAGDAERVSKMLASVHEGMTDFEKAAAIHDAVTKYTTFSEAGRGKNALASEVAMCEGYSEAMIVLLGLSGTEARMIFGKARINPNDHHSWTLVKLDGKQYHIDASWDDVKKSLAREWFLRSDAFMEKTHIWDRERNPSAPEDYDTDRGETETKTLKTMFEESTAGRGELLSKEQIEELFSKVR